MHSQKCFLFFNRRKQKQKYFNFVKKRLVIAVVFNKKGKSTCLKYAKNCSQKYFMLAEENIF